MRGWMRGWMLAHCEPDVLLHVVRRIRWSRCVWTYTKDLSLSAFTIILYAAHFCRTHCAKHAWDRCCLRPRRALVAVKLQFIARLLPTRLAMVSRYMTHWLYQVCKRWSLRVTTQRSFPPTHARWIRTIRSSPRASKAFLGIAPKLHSSRLTPGRKLQSERFRALATSTFLIVTIP